MSGILTAVIIVGGMGILFGILLGVASKIFAVKVDEKVPLIVEVLPGANCGGCGFAGCNAYATAIAEGKAKPNLCPVGGAKATEKISEILGVKAEVQDRIVATVMCNGTCDNAAVKYKFDGEADCYVAAHLGGGGKVCSSGCLGLGNCVKVCRFGAMSIVDGVAKVDREKCLGCGMCVKECPKQIIKLVKYKNKFAVLCQSKEKGKDTKKACSVGCIGCGICAKNCPKEAITIENNHAVIDEEKCVSCGICESKCPCHAIVKVKE